MLKHEFTSTTPLSSPQIQDMGCVRLGLERLLKDVINVTLFHKEFVSRYSGLMSTVQPVCFLLCKAAGLSHPCSAGISC